MSQAEMFEVAHFFRLASIFGAGFACGCAVCWISVRKLAEPAPAVTSEEEKV
jgi:hypothetical protein